MEIWFGLLLLLAAAPADEQAWEQAGRGGDGCRKRVVKTPQVLEPKPEA